MHSEFKIILSPFLVINHNSFGVQNGVRFGVQFMMPGKNSGGFWGVSERCAKRAVTILDGASAALSRCDWRELHPLRKTAGAYGCFWKWLKNQGRPVFLSHLLPCGAPKHRPWRAASERDCIPLVSRDMWCCIVPNPYELGWIDVESGADLEGNFPNGIRNAVPWVSRYLCANHHNATIGKEKALDTADSIAPVAGLIVVEHSHDANLHL
jgi:hypothetical protein